MVRENPHYLFVVFGEGHLRHELQKEITERGLDNNFMLVGFVDNASALLSGLDTEPIVALQPTVGTSTKQLSPSEKIHSEYI